MLNYHRDNDAMSRSVTVIKTRASSHNAGMRQFSISADGISFRDIATRAGEGGAERDT